MKSYSLSDAAWDVCHQALKPGEPASHDQAGGTGLLSHFEEDDIKRDFLFVQQILILNDYIAVVCILKMKWEI